MSHWLAKGIHGVLWSLGQSITTMKQCCVPTLIIVLASSCTHMYVSMVRCTLGILFYCTLLFWMVYVCPVKVFPSSATPGYKILLCISWVKLMHSAANVLSVATAVYQHHDIPGSFKVNICGHLQYGSILITRYIIAIKLCPLVYFASTEGIKGWNISHVTDRNNSKLLYCNITW